MDSEVNLAQRCILIRSPCQANNVIIHQQRQDNSYQQSDQASDNHKTYNAQMLSFDWCRRNYLGLHIHSKDKCDFIPENESIQIQVLKHINEILFSLPFYILEKIFFTPNPCSYLGIAYRWRRDNSRFSTIFVYYIFFAIPNFGKKLPWNCQ